MRREDNIKMDLSNREVCQCWRSVEVAHDEERG